MAHAAMVAAALAFAVPASGQAAPARPDIVVERWSTPSSAPAGGTITVVVHVANAGQSASAPFTNELRLDRTGTGAILTRPARWEAAALQPGHTLRAEVRLPIALPEPAGEYVLRVLADVDRAVAEENEHNNLAERRLIVTARPALTPSP
jgi:subtilase family serine protease